ncbi:MAG: DUF4175 domain-containing protein [Polymorphobacter sp.]
MSADAFVADWSRPARLRSHADTAAVGAPLLLAAAAIAWRWQGAATALALIAAGAALLVVVAAARARRFNQRWLVRQLDAQRPDMEDSADLLLAPPATLGPLQALQRARLFDRLTPADAAALRPGWHSHAIIAAWLASAVIIAITLLWPPQTGAAPPQGRRTLAAGPPQLVAHSLRITPPAYTSLPERRQDRLDARAPQGSTLAWTLRFAPQPAAAALVLTDGSRIALRRDGDAWRAARRLDRSMLYRVVPDGAAGTPPLHRIDAIADTPPAVRVLDPERTLTILSTGQRRWPLDFEVTDDHGIAANARLRIIVTQGEGENISFKESAQTLSGSGDPRRRRFRATLDVTALGLTAGNDLVAQLIVSDNRTPGPQTVRSASLILRWPPGLGEQSGGLDGMVKTVLPAYFRSQRQIIIDIEALLKQRRQLPAASFADRSDAIGEDQRLLRLRYGQFAGQEDSDAIALPTSDAPPPPTDDAKPAPLPQGHAADDGHDHGPKRFGNAADVVADYGHNHGDEDAGSMLDPASRSTLRQALDAMWDTERSLRQGAPAAALPRAYAALRLIKTMQQATRIYLARTGPDLPAIDFARRLSGDRKDITAAALAPLPQQAGDIDAVPAAAWRALAGPGPVPLDALQRWLAGVGARVADPLALAAAIDAVTQDPGCQPCRRSLRNRLWTALTPPPAQVPRRAVPDTAGRRYLEALR